MTDAKDRKQYDGEFFFFTDGDGKAYGASAEELVKAKLTPEEYRKLGPKYVPKKKDKLGAATQPVAPVCRGREDGDGSRRGEVARDASYVFRQRRRRDGS